MLREHMESNVPSIRKRDEIPIGKRMCSWKLKYF
jgi:hypothetical protein